MVSEEPRLTLARILEDEGLEPERLREFLAVIQPVDLAEMLEDLDLDDRIRVLESLEPAQAAGVLEALPSPERAELIDFAGESRLLPILDRMSADAVAEVIDHLPAHREHALMARLGQGQRERVEDRKHHKPQTAGALMTRNYVAVPENFTAGETIRAIQGSVTPETVSVVYVVDDGERLVGVCGLGSLMIHPPETPLADFMRREVHFVGENLDQEEVARIARRSHLKAVPVVDNFMRMVGVVTLRDLLEVVHQEASEDVLQITGAAHVHPVHSPVWMRVRGRLPWLVGAMAIEIALCVVMKGYGGTLAAVATLAYFVPIIMAMGGNVGLQSSTLVVRGLATGDITAGKTLRVIFMESRTGLAIGLLCGAFTGATAWLLNFSEAISLRISCIVTVSMVTSVTFAATIGAFIPFVLRRLRRDPAVASGPFITAFNDMLNVTIYLTLATLLLPHDALPR